jgi:hypothetical protein
MIMEQFSRIPAYVARDIAQEFRSHRRSIGERDVEDAIVDYAKRKYTCFEFRVLTLGEDQTVVGQMIKSRTREVLRAWMVEDVADKDVLALWKRHGLVGDSGPGLGNDKMDDIANIMPWRSLINYCGGLETPLNVLDWT